MADGGGHGMIDLRQATSDSSEWGISLREWMELHGRVYGKPS